MCEGTCRQATVWRGLTFLSSCLQISTCLSASLLSSSISYQGLERISHYIYINDKQIFIWNRQFGHSQGEAKGPQSHLSSEKLILLELMCISLNSRLMATFCVWLMKQDTIQGLTLNFFFFFFDSEGEWFWYFLNMVGYKWENGEGWQEARTGAGRPTWCSLWLRET